MLEYYKISLVHWKNNAIYLGEDIVAKRPAFFIREGKVIHETYSFVMKVLSNITKNILSINAEAINNF